MPVDIAALERQAEIVEMAMQQAVAEELLMHKRLGHSIVVYEEDAIRVIPPDDIEIDDVP